MTYSVKSSMDFHVDGIKYNAEMAKPGYVIIRHDDVNCGDIEIDIFNMSVKSHNVDPKYAEVIDKLSQGMEDRLNHLGQWYDPFTHQWRSYDLHPNHL